jgi:choline dehydrogenase-like flavoprotein
MEVLVRCLGGGGFRVRAETIVLATGGVENARLLLVASRRHRSMPSVGGTMVGRCFMEHPRLASRFGVRAGATPLSRLLGAGAGAAGTLRFLRVELSPETQRRERLLAWHANLHFGYMGQDSVVWPSVRRLAIATRTPWRESPYFQDGGGGRTRIRSADVASLARRPIAGLLGAVGAVACPPRLRRWLEIVASVEQLPRAENRIELTDQLDPLGVPRVRITWGVDDAEERTNRRGMELLLQALERVEPEISRHRIPSSDAWPEHLIGTWHHIGATRMSANTRSGVVDADSKVHGLDNLFVIGSSVFPVSGSTSPTITTIQLALRLGDHLAARLERRPVSLAQAPSAVPLSG